MKVIWTWKNKDLFKWVGEQFVCADKFQLLLLIASFASWHKHYPDDELVFYCDTTTSDYLFEEGTFLEKYLNFDLKVKQIILDFETIKKQYNFPDSIWAWPKLYTAGIQDEPFIMVDRDIVVNGDFKECLDPDNVWCFCNYVKSNTRKCWDERIYEQVGGFWKPGANGMHTCLAYFPNPFIAKLMVVNCLEKSQRMLRYVAEHHTYWDWHYSTSAEEWALYDIVSGLGLNIQDIVYTSKLVEHVDKKSGFTKKEYEENVGKLLKIIDIPEAKLLEKKKVLEPEHNISLI